MQEDFLTLPTKSSEEAFIVDPFKQFLIENYDLKFCSEEVSSSINELQRMRKEIIEHLIDLDDEVCIKIQRYTILMEYIEKRFRSNSYNIPFSFKWNSCLPVIDQDNSCFPTAKIAFERSCMVFNLAAIYSQRAAKQSKETQHNTASESFLTSARLFDYARKIMPEFKCTVPTKDVLCDAMQAYVNIMLAQSTECRYKHEQTGKGEPDLIFQLAQHASTLYAKAIELTEGACLPTKWISTLNDKAHLMRSVVSQQMSSVQGILSVEEPQLAISLPLTGEAPPEMFTEFPPLIFHIALKESNSICLESRHKFTKSMYATLESVYCIIDEWDEKNEKQENAMEIRKLFKILTDAFAENSDVLDQVNKRLPKLLDVNSTTLRGSISESQTQDFQKFQMDLMDKVDELNRFKKGIEFLEGKLPHDLIRLVEQVKTLNQWIHDFLRRFDELPELLKERFMDLYSQSKQIDAQKITTDEIDKFRNEMQPVLQLPDSLRGKLKLIDYKTDQIEECIKLLTEGGQRQSAMKNELEILLNYINVYETKMEMENEKGGCDAIQASARDSALTNELAALGMSQEEAKNYLALILLARKNTASPQNDNDNQSGSQTLATASVDALIGELATLGMSPEEKRRYRDRTAHDRRIAEMLQNEEADQIASQTLADDYQLAVQLQNALNNHPGTQTQASDPEIAKQLQNNLYNQPGTQTQANDQIIAEHVQDDLNNSLAAQEGVTSDITANDFAVAWAVHCAENNIETANTLGQAPPQGS